MILEYNSKDPKGNMLSCYQFMKQKLIYITKIYTQESYFHAEDKLESKLGKMLYYNILKCQGYLLIF